MGGRRFKLRRLLIVEEVGEVAAGHFRIAAEVGERVGLVLRVRGIGHLPIRAVLVEGDGF